MDKQTPDYDKMIETTTDIVSQEKAITQQTRLTTESVWKLLVRGETPKNIQNKLEITPQQYKDAVYNIVTTTKPNTDDIDRERKLAHDRYLNIYRKLHDQYDQTETPAEMTMVARELRATVKDIGDIYSIKMAEKLEIDININEREEANRTIERLLQKMRGEPKAIEAEIVEDDDDDPSDLPPDSEPNSHPTDQNEPQNQTSPEANISSQSHDHNEETNQ